MVTDTMVTGTAVTATTVTTLMDRTVTDTISTVSTGMHVPTSYVLERRKPEPRGFIGNLSRIPISGCLQ